jgi:hypothetical protein
MLWKSGGRALIAAKTEKLLTGSTGFGIAGRKSRLALVSHAAKFEFGRSGKAPDTRPPDAGPALKARKPVILRPQRISPSPRWGEQMAKHGKVRACVQREIRGKYEATGNA